MYQTKKKSLLKEILDWFFHIAIAVVLGILIVTFVAQRTIVFNFSMEPTLYEGDNLIVEKIGPRFNKFKRGDIVTIKDATLSLSQEEKTIIKRIIALENDKIEIKDGKVYVNDEELDEPYINGDYTREVDPRYSSLTVPEGYVYVLGDNRKANIVDSRSIGLIAMDKIEARAIVRIYPFNKIGLLK